MPKAKSHSEPKDRIFIGMFPAGISYADKEVEQDGDYKKLAFLDYETLQLSVAAACPPQLRDYIAEDAKQYHVGDVIQVSGAGQTRTLGTRKPCPQCKTMILSIGKHFPCERSGFCISCGYCETCGERLPEPGEPGGAK